MNLDEFTEQYGGRPFAFKGVGVTTANDRPMAKNQRMVIEAHQDVYNIPYATIGAQALGDIIAMDNLTFNQAALVILKGTELIREKEAAGVSNVKHFLPLPPEDRPILPAQMLRLYRIKDDRGSELVNIRAGEILGETGTDFKLKNLTRGEANKIINAVITTPRPRRRAYQEAYRRVKYEGV